MDMEVVALPAELPFEKITKVGNPLFSEAIFVSDRSKTVEANAAIGAFDSDHFYWCQDCVGETVMTYASPWSNHHHATVPTLWYEGEIKIFRKWVWQQFSNGINPQFVSGRLTGIQNAKLINEPFLVFFALNEKVLSNNMNVGPQLPFGGAFQVFQLPFAGLPQFISGPIQNIGEQGDQNGAKRYDVVVAGIVPDAPDKPENRFMHGGAGIIAGIIFGICFLAYQYARGRL
jgi:hypothetical protein